MPVASGSIAYLGAARFKGYWNASSNAASGSGLPAEPQGTFSTLLIDGGYNAGTNLTAAAGDYWQVTASGTTSVNGQASWGNNDWCIYSASAGGTGTWRKLAFEDTVASIIIGDLSSSSFHMGAQYDRHVIFTSGSNALHGVDNFTFDYTSNTLNLTGTMHVSGAGITLVGPEAGAVALTLKADQGDDAADTTTITVVDGGNTTIATGADLVLDPGGGDVQVDGHLSPGSDSADSLGRPGVAWSTLYVDNVDLDGQGRIDLDDDQDTSIRASADDTIKIEVGASDLVTIDAAGIALTGQVSGSGRGIFVDELRTAGNLNVSGTATMAGAASVGTRLLIADNAPVNLGNNSDVTIFYDEANVDKLIISGAAGGFDIDLPDNVANAFSITEEANPYITVITTNSSEAVLLSQDAWIIDDKKLYFGTGKDSSIEYDEDDQNFLIISGSSRGMVLSGSTINFDGAAFFANNVSSSAKGIFVDELRTAGNLNVTGNANIDGRATIGTQLIIPDNIMIALGNSTDARILYDEANVDKLIISGAAAGFDIDLPDNVANAFSITEEANPYITVITTNSSEAVLLSQDTWIIDDKKLYFGTGKDASIEYDEDGVDKLIISGSTGGFDIDLPNNVASAFSITEEANAYVTVVTTDDSEAVLFSQDVHVIDDKDIHFGTSKESSIRYDEAGQDMLIISGSSFGTTLSGSLIRVIDKLSIGTDTSPAKTSGILLVSAHADDTTNGLIATFKSGDSDYGRVNIDNTTANGDTQFTFMSNGSSKWSIGNMGSNETFHIKAGFGSFTDTDPFILNNSGFDFNSPITASQHVRVEDGKKLYFGTGNDASVEYDEAGVDKLIISGAAGGFDIDLPDNVANAFSIMEEANAYVTVVTSNSSERVKLSQDVTIIDDKKLHFGTGEDASFEYDEDGTDTLLYAGAPLRISDDVTLQFGSGGDATIEYDENGVDKLIISGAAGGFDIDLPDNVANAFSITEEANPYITVITTNSSEAVMFSQDAWLIDDKKLHLGTNKDASIEYDEDDQNLLIISGSSRGMVLSGSNINIGGTRDMLTTVTKIGGKVGVNDFDPKVSFTVTNNFQAPTFENQLADGEGGGRKLIYSPGANDSLTAGQLYFLHTDGTWDACDADAVATGATQLLGVGLGANSQVGGVLVEGFIKIPSTEILNLPGSGAVDGLPLYVSTTAGHFDFTAPSGNNDFVRIVGYAIDDDSSDVLVYFDPDKTHVVVSA